MNQTKTVGPGTSSSGASPKQQYWIDKCLAERVVSPALAERAVQALSRKDASAVLTSLFECPKKVAAVQYTQTEPAKIGYYLHEDWPHVVVENPKNGNRSAKRLVLPDNPKCRAKWIYAKGVVFKLAGQEPLTLREACDWGHLNGHCICCGDRLDHPLSVLVGIGPSCVRKHFGMTQLQFLKSKKESAK